MMGKKSQKSNNKCKNYFEWFNDCQKCRNWFQKERLNNNKEK